ncbi:MAG TPA: 5'/3'-nucleotidase SurE [Treponemataceae bacterium]|nr:5'/3'-nucleotidase SurE [Treponemataceae bacterium]
MRILLVNDDGINEKGLQVLVDVFEEHHEVWVIAPDKNRSGVSHGITMHSPHHLHQIAKKKFSYTGLPVDCTVAGCNGALGFTPDIVLSGINKGANIGTDIVYSGTAAAARQASLYNIPGIAVSLESKSNRWNYKPLAEFVLDNLQLLISLCEKNMFLNINAIDLDVDQNYKGVKYTIPSEREYGDKLVLYTAPNEDTYTFFKGGNVKTKPGKTTDFSAVEDGYISISRVLAQPVANNVDTVPVFTLRG